jgi:two-component system cell cycle sensor histidine kinase/response regulator CckA
MGTTDNNKAGKSAEMKNKSKQEQDSGDQSGSETVLLVEDVEGLRKLSRRILESNGYKVIEAHDSEHALEICRQYPETLDLLLTDVVLPRMNGPELATRMICLRPKARVLYMSGYTEDAMLSQVIQSVFIQKPFTPGELARKVRAVLDAPARPGPLSVQAGSRSAGKAM